MSGSSPATARRVLEVVGGKTLADDPRFTTNLARVENVDLLDRLIGDWIASRSLDEALAAFEEAEAPIGPVYGIADIVEDPHFRAREAVTRFDGVMMQGMIAKLSETPGSLRLPAPAKGEHNEEILAEIGLRPSATGD
jgi:crotonobetainyl-CoA:carnitine CoA-transferase CaiB-like acyl-CoA transferase